MPATLPHASRRSFVLGSGAALVAAALTTHARAETAKSAEALRPLYAWGEAGRGTGQFRAVRGIAVYDRRPNEPMVVVADGGNDVLRSYTWNMMFVDKWGGFGRNPGQFHEPRGVAIDNQGLLVVADAYNHRIQKTKIGTESFLERPGEVVVSFGKKGTGKGEFDTPTGIGTDGTGAIYVADTNNHRIQKFDQSGRFLAAFGERGTEGGQFYLPSYVVCDGKGRVFVSDTGNNRIQAFSDKGSFLFAVSGIGSKPGFLAEPKGMAFDRNGDLWVVDRRNHRLQKFGSDGEPLAVYGKQGPGKGEFSFPEAVAIDSSGRVYVTDGMNSRIQVLQS